jgi:hypothetical protein
MLRIDRFRVTAAVGTVLLLGLAAVALTTSAGASGGGLHAKPAGRLDSGDIVNVYGKNLIAGDEVVLMECLRTATDLTGCNLATTTEPVTISSTGKLPATAVTVMTGNVGTGTCGTSKTDARDCEIALQDITGTTTFLAYVNITFAKNATTTTTLPTIPTTLPTIPTTLPTIPASPPTTLPSLPGLP